MEKSRIIARWRASRTLRTAQELGVLLAGCAVYSLGVKLFFIPQEITTGGLTGLATTLHYLSGLPIGTTVLFMNIPLVALCWRFFGFRFIAKTSLTLLILTFTLDFMPDLPALISDKLLSALFGGLCIGLGMGLLFIKGYTTGGTDLIVWLLRLKFKNLSTGVLVMLADAVVIALQVAVTRDIMSVLYSVVAIYTSTRLIDTVMSSADRAKMTLVITDSHAQVAQALGTQLARGVTALDSVGWYTGANRKILLCVVGRAELYRLKQIVTGIDPGAFLITCDAAQVIGKGFNTKPLG